MEVGHNISSLSRRCAREGKEGGKLVRMLTEVVEIVYFVLLMYIVKEQNNSGVPVVQNAIIVNGISDA